MAEEIRVAQQDLDIFKNASELINKRVSDFRKEVVASVATVAGLAQTTKAITSNLDRIVRSFRGRGLTTQQQEAVGGFGAGVETAVPFATAAAALLPGLTGLAAGAGVLAIGGALGAAQDVGASQRAREADRIKRLVGEINQDLLRRKDMENSIRKVSDLERIRKDKSEALLRRMRRGS